MTATTPAFYALVSRNEESRYEFQPCGGHQAYCRRYVKDDNGEWALLSVGCNWIGIMMRRYDKLTKDGFVPSF
jgi:hypothetical protein